ncbi:RNA-binding protein 44 [Archocentrus centrarchus]|uniref:RNA-binding protein 44 n=1 Tax=Archocentrus centrarchus TaxID=63155 RepID=UPI0011EA5031|nr:RNA-binding protein 44 [Archocentrus centrarchus]XP_030613401.1 RNA-binding protein 44 [Archocentrus centrarchus]
MFNPADAWWTSWPVLYGWRPPEDFHRQTVSHASSQDFSGTFLSEVPAHRSSYSTSYSADVSMSSGFHNPAIKRPTPRESRRFFLDRSVYDLVASYTYLTLTDRRLLGWYLCLSPEDRKLIQDEGGLFQYLERHPALEINRHHLYVKYSTGATQPATTADQQASVTAGAETDICETPNIHLDLDILPSSEREKVTLVGCNSNMNRQQEELCGQEAHVPDGFHTGSSSPGTQETNHLKACYRPGLPLSQLNEQRHSGQTGSSAAVCEDPAGLASFSLDMELEQCRQRGKLKPRSQISVPQGQSADFSPSQSDWSMATRESPSECNSIDSNQMVGPAYNDRSIVQAVELALVQAEENATKHVCQDKDVHGTKYTADDGTLLSFENESDTFHSLMEDDKSILIYLARNTLQAQHSRAQSCPVTTNSGDTLAAGTEESYQSATKVKTAEKHTSPLPCVSTCDAMIGTELVLCPSVFTQTEDLETADKHINTEVHMADLDYIAKELSKLKKAQEVKERKEKTKSVGCKLRGECECMERVKQAELALLALQYSVCKQHCWRLYYTCAEGNQLTSVGKDPPPNIISVLQKLELEYNEMKSKIQAGVPLQQLKPLSVDSGEIVTGGNYIPAQIICEVLGEVSSRSSQEPQKLNTPGGDGGGGCPDNQSREVLQVGQEEEKGVTKEIGSSRKAATLFPQDGASARQEVKTGEKWYDAEEDLEIPGDAVAAAVTQDSTLVTVDTVYESASEEVESSVLCVSNLPINVTESAVMLLFEKYLPSAVSISVLQDLRFAVVMLSGPQSADAAVRELNGCRMQGCTLRLEHISGTGSSSQASARKPDSSQDAAKPQTSKMD